MLNKIDVRLVPPVLISLILVAAHLSFGILRGFDAIVLAIGASVVTELILCRLYWGNWPHLASAYTTGISVGILVRSPMLWPFALCSVVSIMSKYVLRVKERHLWNPSNFGVSVLFFPAAYGLLNVAPLNTQWGNNMWPMLVIWIIGLITIWRVKRFHITATYIVAFVALSFVRSLVTGDPFWAEVAPITGPMYQLFALFMITDPKTTVSSRRGEMAVAVCIAIVECFLRIGALGTIPAYFLYYVDPAIAMFLYAIFLVGPFVAAPFYALFIVGPIAMLVDIYWTGEEETEARDESSADDVPAEPSVATESAS